MRRHPANPPSPSADANAVPRSDWATLQTLFPYLWVYKWRVLAALACLIGAKVANVGIPVVMKHLIDALTIGPSNPKALLVLPLGALVAYGALRLSTTVFTELREFLFARVTQRAVRTIALEVFRHLHVLPLAADVPGQALPARPAQAPRRCRCPRPAWYPPPPPSCRAPRR